MSTSIAGGAQQTGIIFHHQYYHVSHSLQHTGDAQTIGNLRTLWSTCCYFTYQAVVIKPSVLCQIPLSKFLLFHFNSLYVPPYHITNHLHVTWKTNPDMQHEVTQSAPSVNVYSSKKVAYSRHSDCLSCRPGQELPPFPRPLISPMMTYGNSCESE